MRLQERAFAQLPPPSDAAAGPITGLRKHHGLRQGPAGWLNISAIPSPLSAEIIRFHQRSPQRLTQSRGLKGLRVSRDRSCLRPEPPCLDSSKPSTIRAVSLSIPRLASTTSIIRSASLAPRQAASTIARSKRRRGSKIPGVSMNTIWLSSLSNPHDANTGCLHLVRHYVDLGTDQPVDQCRLTGIAPSTATKPHRIWGASFIDYHPFQKRSRAARSIARFEAQLHRRSLPPQRKPEP